MIKIYNFTDIKLLDESNRAEERKIFWDHCMEVMQEVYDESLAALVIGPKIEGVGGYFTGKDYINRIVLPGDAVEFDSANNTVKFKNEHDFGVFVHEWGHFEHLACDRGKFNSPAFAHLEPFEHAVNGSHLRSNTKYLEYEAGYRSMYNNLIYEMFDKGDRTILELNLTNLANYMTLENVEEYKETTKDMSTEDRTEYFQKIINGWKEKVQTWAEVSDFIIHP